MSDQIIEIIHELKSVKATLSCKVIWFDISTNKFFLIYSGGAGQTLHF